MATKSEYLQLRVTPGQKAALKRLARASGQDVSRYVLARALPELRIQFEGIMTALSGPAGHRFALAELNDFLVRLAPFEFPEAVGRADLGRLSPFIANYVAAMVEQASHTAGVPSPEWTSHVAPLDQPRFATPMKSLRLHLLRAAPVPFKKRNLFVDAAIGARV